MGQLTHKALVTPTSGELHKRYNQWFKNRRLVNPLNADQAKSSFTESFQLNKYFK